MSVTNAGTSDVTTGVQSLNLTDIAPSVETRGRPEKVEEEVQRLCLFYIMYQLSRWILFLCIEAVRAGGFHGVLSVASVEAHDVFL